MGTFAVAALIVAVLFADRLGPPEELRRRLYQVGLGVTGTILITALTAVAVSAPETTVESFGLGPLEEDSRGILRERLSVLIGGGLLLLIAALYLSRLAPTMSIGIMLGGLLLLITSLADTGSGGFINFYYEIALDGGEERNLIFAAVAAVGVLLLLLYGFNEWDRPQALEEGIDSGEML